MNLRTIGLLAGMFAAIAAPAQAARLTHVVILVRDVQAARRAFTDAGFKIQPTTALSRGLVHAVIRFRDGTFLELIGALPHTPGAADLSNFVRFGDAVSGAGFEVSNVYAERALLRARGFRIDSPQVSPHWVDLSFSEPAGILEPFFLYQYRGDYAKRAARMYTALALSQPDAAIGIRGIDVAVEPGLHAAATYAAAGLRGVTAIESGAGDARIVLVRIATFDPQRRGTTIVVDRCRIRFE